MVNRETTNLVQRGQEASGSCNGLIISGDSGVGAYACSRDCYAKVYCGVSVPEFLSSEDEVSVRRS